MASHDLQEPLRKIRTFSDRLYLKYKEQLDNDGISNIKRIQNAAERMQELIKDILTFSKLSIQKDAFVKADLGMLVQEVLDDLHHSLVEKNAHVELGALPSLYVNPGLIKPLFFNLISNALKYSKKDQPPVIQIYPEKPDKGRVGWFQKNIAGSISRTMVLGLTSNMPNRSLRCFSGCTPKMSMKAPELDLLSASK
jgi:light-regulated signal transduction histidine kinase (bacteriophytochrome)